MMRLKIVFLLVFLWVLPGVGTAQDETNALLDMLALVPMDSPATGLFMTYTDIDAMANARPGLTAFDSWADVMTAFEAGDDSAHLWIAALNGLVTNAPFFSQVYRQGALWPEVVGFDFVDIDRILAYGDPPSTGVILEGSFDTGSIAQALTARDYTGEEMGAFTLWCGAAGCENGVLVDLSRREPANPFGGQFFREEPVLVSAELIINSADIAVIQSHQDLMDGEGTSLAENPIFIAGAEGVDGDGLLIQAALMNPAVFLADVGGLTAPDPAAAEHMQKFVEGSRPFPQYELVLVADRATDTEQVVLVALVYTSEADAQSAADELASRVTLYFSSREGILFTEVLENVGVTAYDIRVLASESVDKVVTVVEFRAPLASNEPHEGQTPRFDKSSAVYVKLLSMVFSRDMTWLTPVLPS